MIMKRLSGSGKEPHRKARHVGDVDPEKMMSVTVILRPKAKLKVGRAPISRQEFAAKFGADPAHVAKVEEYAAAHHLSVHDVNIAARTVVLRGRTADMQKAFGVELKLYATEDNKRFRGREGNVFVPDELHGIIEAVFGLDDRPAAKPHLRKLSISDLPTKQRSSKRQPKPLRVRDVAKLYGFPARLDGSGQTIGMIELGGGFRKHDLDLFFKELGVKSPAIAAVGVHGATNDPGHEQLEDGEVTLDLEIAGALAPKAKYVVYFAPNTNAGFLAALNAAIHDDIRNPGIISISWGGPELTWTAASRKEVDYALQAAAAMGVTVIAAAGDDGASDGVDDGKPHVDFPASSPHVLACGGTRVIRASATKIAAETVWNNGPTGNGAGGGGFSEFFPKPAYQKTLKVPRRGLPDIAGNADPHTGYRIVFGGKDVVAGGTSAVAPLYSALTALLNQARERAKLPPLGFINPVLYAERDLCRNVLRKDNDYSGNIGVHKAGPGWNACAGLGSVIGQKWVAVFTRETTASAD
jgi:kumamolisin